MKALKWIGIVVGVIVAIPIVISLVARFGDGPTAIFPGGPLEAGELHSGAEPDWSFARDIAEMEFELVSTGTSRTIWLEVVDGKAISRALAFAVTMDDTNGDGALDDLDAALVLVTDGDGRNPRFVSPPEQQVASLEFAAGGDVLLLMLRADANGDSEFEADEPLTPWVVDVPSGSKARRLVGSESPGAASGLLGDG